MLKEGKITPFDCGVLKIKVASYFQRTLIALSIWVVFPQRLFWSEQTAETTTR